MRRIWAFVAINVGLVIQAAMVTLKMNENTPRGKEIAQLRSSLDQSAIESNTELEFRIVRQDRQNGLELFDIDGTQGRLIVKQSPDREILCPDPLAQCLLKLQIVVLPQAYYQDLSVEIEVIDQNDNAPRFQQETINIEIFENSHAAYSLDHQMAYDPDIGKNGDIVYSLSSEEYFTLEQYTDDSGDHLDLIPAGNLDHEKTASLTIQMIASNPVSDDDLTVQSSRVNLAITVLDKNEFKPSFDKETYEFKISESASPGTKIGQVVIFDGDGIDQLELSIRELQARSYFRIESNGELYTNRKLDFEVVQRFEFWIMASDSTYSERARVIVTIVDENDNEPNVFVAFNTPHKNIPRAGWVTENEPAGAHIAYIRAEDADSNGIGDIELLEKEYFELDKGIIKTKTTLDREQHSEYNLHIKACDQGQPRKCTKLRLIVFVRDQNDNMPICSENPALAVVSESAEVGTFITEAHVTDADDGDTNGLGFGVLNYQLEPAGQKFTIDSASGVITLANELDYEEQRTWNMMIVARDGGAQETRCQLIINVQDVNEAAPIFQTPSEDDLELLISTSELAGTMLMQAEAIDVDYNVESNPDEDPVISYALNGDHQSAIQINQLTGELELLVDAAQLSNELPTFRLIITATDTGSPRLTTSIRLTVAVREGVETGLVEMRRALKGGATVALIAILAALTALLFIILVALAFICRHRKLIKSVRYPTMYTHGSSTNAPSERPDTPNSRCDEIENFVKVHEDVSILYDSILTPRSSIGPAQLYKTDFKSRLMQKTHLEKLFKRKYKHSQRDTASESDHADSGKGESDHDTINPAGGPRCDETCLRLGHSDSCWIEEDSLSQESKSAFKCSIVHTHNPSLHKSFEKKKDIHSSGYISQDTDEIAIYGQIMSTPIKPSYKGLPDQISSSSAASVQISSKNGLIVANKGDIESGMETGSAVSSGIGGTTTTTSGCVIDVRGSNISSSDHLTVRDLASLRRTSKSHLAEVYNHRHATPSPKKVNIV